MHPAYPPGTSTARQPQIRHQKGRLSVHVAVAPQMLLGRHLVVRHTALYSREHSLYHLKFRFHRHIAIIIPGHGLLYDSLSTALMRYHIGADRGPGLALVSRRKGAAAAIRPLDRCARRHAVRV